MVYRFIILLAMLSAMSSAQSVNLRGTVTNGNGDPISGAIVTLLGLDLKDTTGSDGVYAITQTTPVTPRHSTADGMASLSGNVLELNLSRPATVTIEVFDILSNLLKTEKRNAEAGTYRWHISKNYPTNQLLFIRATVEGKTSTFRYMPLTGAQHGNIAGKNSSSEGDFLAKAAAAVDSLEVKAAGYGTKVVEVESYDETLDVSLNIADKWGGIGNPPVKSGGCGQPQGITNGKKTINSGGRNRSYIIDIPTSYDPDTPHLLFYTPHWIDGLAEEVRDNDYYFLKPLAQADNKPSIFVAPQSVGGTWQEYDHEFFDDLMAYVEDNLCIDTTRLFVTGFSFGGMYTYSLSTNHQHKIRAASGLGPANYNIWIPDPKLTEPIPWMSTTGMSDGLTPWDGGNGRGAKYIALEKAADNGCDIPAGYNIPTWQSGPHFCYEFEGCDEGYPVKACTFNGGHTDLSRDPGESEYWIPQESWEFFMRF